MKLFRSIATVGFYTMASRFFGFIRTILTASYLGAGAISDALEIAIKFPSFLRRLFAEGAFNAAFVPLFAGTLAEDGQEKAKSMAEEILAVFLLTLFILVLLVEIFMGDLIPLLLPGFKKTPERLCYAIAFTRITFPFIFFISLTALYSGILNSLDRFAAVAASPMAGNMAIIATIMAFSSQMQSPGHAFAVGVILCGVIQLLWVWVPALRLGYGLRIIWPRITPAVKGFLVKLGPAAASSGVVQLNILLGMAIASYLPEGGVSYLSYADRLNQLPLSVIGTAIGTAILPLLSRQIRSGRQDTAFTSQNDALEVALFLTLPATVGLMVLAHPLVVGLFQREAFNAHCSTETAHALMAFALGLPAYILSKIFSAFFFAHQNTRTPLKSAVISVGVDLILSILLIGPYGHIGIALATALSAWVNAIIMGFLLIKRGYFVMNPRLKYLLPRYGVVTLVTAFYLQWVKDLFESWLYQGLVMKVSALSFLVASGLLVFFGFARLWGIIHWKRLTLVSQEDTP